MVDIVPISDMVKAVNLLDVSLVGHTVVGEEAVFCLISGYWLPQQSLVTSQFVGQSGLNAILLPATYPMGVQLWTNKLAQANKNGLYKGILN